MSCLSHADPFLFESLLVDLGPLVDTLGKRDGGWCSFAAESAQTGAGWRAVPWFWVAFPATYNMAHFRKAGLEYPKSWDELLKHGKLLKKQGTPVGIPIATRGDANTTFWSVFWSYGGKVSRQDGKTPAINSERDRAGARMVQGALQGRDGARGPLLGRFRPITASSSPARAPGSTTRSARTIAALTNKMPIADDINHHPSPAGPAGIHSAPGINAIAIWKFSKNAEPAKEFIEFLFRKENYDAWIVASNAFNQPPLRDLADHPIWVRNPKFAMLPKEAEYAHARGWPARPNDAVRRIENNYILPDMVSKTIPGHARHSA